MKILIINGPNLNKLPERNEEQYGSTSISDIEQLIRKEFSTIQFNFFQSNSEGKIIDVIQDVPGKFDGLIINPGGYSHTSVAIRDALEICSVPKVEIHLSHLATREEFRQKLITAAACDGYISGFGEQGYLAAVYTLIKIIGKRST